MNTVEIPIPNVDNTVVRRSVHNASVFLSDMLDIKPFLVKVDDKIESEVNAIDEDHAARTLEEKVRIYVQEKSNEVSFNSGYGYRELNDPFILDNGIGLKFVSKYHGMDLECTYKYESKNRSDVENVRTKLINIHNASRSAFMLSLKYNYILPKPATSLLNEINNLKNIQENDSSKKELYEYMAEISTNNLIVSSDIKFKKAYYYISEEQSEVITYLPSNVDDYKIDVDNDVRRYFIEIPFNFTLNIPKVMQLNYPSSVYGKLLNPKYTVSRKVLNKKGIAKGLNSSTRDDIFSFKEDTIYPTIPASDRAVLQPTNGLHVILFTVLCDVSDGSRLLFNLDTDLSTLALQQDVIDFLKNGEYEYATKPLRSIFNIQLFNANKIIRYDKLYLDSDLNIFTTEPLDPKGQYRVAFSIAIDTDLMQVKDIDRADEAGMVNKIKEFLNIPIDYVNDKGRYKNKNSIKYIRGYNRIIEFRSFIKAALLTNKDKEK